MYSLHGIEEIGMVSQIVLSMETVKSFLWGIRRGDPIRVTSADGDVLECLVISRRKIRNQDKVKIVFGDEKPLAHN